ncbi:MAG: subclass B3 metallo-beta-lactamase [Bacteroidetes bacterium]|nr:subclass B3 metallo-beta-lactamase [Bacteroidota bacterium]
MFFDYAGMAQVEVHEPTLIDSTWTKPYAPFRIVGNLYYVGTYDLASYLITTPQGHILINTGLASSADMIRHNIEALGFKITDVKILLTNQAHFDHMGGMAAVQKMSGAKMMADAGDVGVIEDGGNTDYVFGGHGAMYEPLKVNRVLHDGDVISLGGMKLTILHHPGHTKGSCSYLFTVKDEKRQYRVLIANMPTILNDVNPAGMPGYANVGKDFEYTYNAMPKLKFDIWLAAHASQFELHKKHQPGDKYNPAAFIDRKGYDKLLDKLHADYITKARK